MLSKEQLVAFVGASSAERAQSVLSRNGRSAPMFDANGGRLTVSLVPKVEPARYTVLGWVVSDIGAKITQMTAAGVKFERYPGMEQDPLGIWTVPSGAAQVAWFKDPDGNTLSITHVA